MCIVSAISDNWTKRLQEYHPQVPLTPVFPIPEITRSEFEDLKKEFNQLKELLKQAKRFDEATGQPDCEMDQKITFLKQTAAALGLEITDVFPTQAQ